MTKAEVRRITDRIRAQAARMEKECKHQPCVHAQGLRLAIEIVQEAAKCYRCGADPEGHFGDCPTWEQAS